MGLERLKLARIAVRAVCLTPTPPTEVMEKLRTLGFDHRTAAAARLYEIDPDQGSVKMTPDWRMQTVLRPLSTR